MVLLESRYFDVSNAPFDSLHRPRREILVWILKKLKTIRRAGFEPWPRIWQNLRSSRETELAEDHPLHVVCAWIWNTERIAARHYLQVTDAHFEKALHSALQYEAELSGTNSGLRKISQINDATNYASKQKKSGPTPICETALMGDTGIEPVTSTV